jgi:hypothetical protein
MLVHNKPSAAARMALAYITIGALTIVWTGVWWAYMRTQDVQSPTSFYLCTGFMLTGITLLVIGLALGRIGRAARPADVGGIEVPGHGQKPGETVPVTAAPPPPPAPAGPAVMPVATVPTTAPGVTVSPTAIPATQVPVSPPSGNGVIVERQPVTPRHPS